MNEQLFRSRLCLLFSPLFWIALYGLLLASAARPCYGQSSKNLTMPAKAKTKLNKDIDLSKITTIRMPDKPNESHHPVKARIYDGLCSAMRQSGYSVETGSSAEWPETEARADFSVKFRKGGTEAAWAAKMGFEGGSNAENYTLEVSLRLKGKVGKLTKTAFSAKCKMWYKFVPSKRQSTRDMGAYTLITWPVDRYGEGPDTLEKACYKMPEVILEELPDKKPDKKKPK
ncbi:MAG: hypothetical protein GXP25_21920 [Planctomycetes bacterium]|nr:hypothetical protein [Planctomycetota bacterium]